MDLENEDDHKARENKALASHKRLQLLQLLRKASEG